MWLAIVSEDFVCVSFKKVIVPEINLIMLYVMWMIFIIIAGTFCNLMKSKFKLDKNRTTPLILW